MTEGTPPSPDQPPPYGQPFGQPPQPGQPPAGPPSPPPYSPPPSHDQPSYGQPAHGQPPTGRDPERRPATVLTAAILTWVFAGIAALGAAFVLLAVAADRESVIEEVEREEDFSELGWSGEEVADALNVFGIVTIVLSILAIVLAVMAFRRSQGGRIGLVVLSSATALVCLALFLACVPLLWLVASAATVVLLFTGGANDWYARRAAPPPAPSPSGDPGQWPQA